MCKCVDCGKAVPRGCTRCMECCKRTLKETFAKSPEVKQAFKETLDEMSKPESVEKMTHEIMSTIQPVIALQRALKNGGGTDAV